MCPNNHFIEFIEQDNFVLCPKCELPGVILEDCLILFP